MDAPAPETTLERAGVVPAARPVAAAAGGLWLVAVLAAVGAAALIVPVRRLPESSGPLLPMDFASPLLGAVIASLGLLIVLRGDAARYGWVLLAIGFSTNVVSATAEYSVYAWLSDEGLPFAMAAGWVQELWLVSWAMVWLLLPALFPDGTAASPRWRRAVQGAMAGWVVLVVVFLLTDRPLENAFLAVGSAPANPTGLLPVPLVAISVLWMVLTLASVGIGIGSMVTRWRDAGEELRQQIKWVLLTLGILLTVAAFDLGSQVLVEAVNVDIGLRVLLSALMVLAIVGVEVAVGLAVLRYGLYNVDLVINRTILYAVLTLLIVLAYVAVVAGVGALLPAGDLSLSLLATGIVAVSFAPVRASLQRAVNRMMFGQRDEPYTVLSELGKLLSRSAAPDAALVTLCETVAEALKLPGAALDLEQNGAWNRRAVYGSVTDAVTGGAIVLLYHQGELVGRLVAKPRSPREHLTMQDHRLLEDVAHHAGALVNAVRLTAALQQSRERLVLAREEERRRIRRDLHDGLGTALASQTFRLDEVLARLVDDPDSATSLVMSLKRQNQQLVADIRKLVYELRPPALDELGVAGALAVHAEQLDSALTVVVETEPDPLPPLSAAVEVAAYRIAREAITNVVSHAGASRCTVALRLGRESILISVTDNGAGPGHHVSPGVGTRSMREHAEELGGEFDISERSPSGTRVRAIIPLAGGGASESKPIVGM